MPAPREFEARLSPVLHVLYLIFNEGYTSSAGADLHRPDLSGEAIRLTRAMHARLPERSEVTGLLALMLLSDARRPARTGARGELIPLAEQDRTRWHRPAIAEGVRLAATARSGGVVGEYQLQAAIAALHDGAERPEDTDWPQILGLYGLLARLSGNPMVELNRAVAAAMVHGPRAGLELSAPLEERLAGHYRLDAVRGHLLDMIGDSEAAAAHYRAAAARTTSEPERQYLVTKAAQLNKQNRQLPGGWRQSSRTSVRAGPRPGRPGPGRPARSPRR
jgi:predicted RNA polymerase sigma factor